MEKINLRLIFSFLLFGSLISARTSPVDTDSALIGGDNDRRDDVVEPLVAKGSNSNSNGNSNTSDTIGTLSLPKGYNKLVIPLANISTHIFVQVYVAIREVLDVDTKGEMIELDTELGLSWIDWEIWKHYLDDEEARERGKAGPEEVTLDSEFLRQMWKPDIYIDEMASVDRTSLLSKLITLKFLVRNKALPGAISYKSRQSLKLRCDMDFKYYPADTQTCEYKIRSYSYPENQLRLTWSELYSVYLDKIDDPNFDFQISAVEPGGELEDLFITSQTRLSQTNYAALSFTIKIRRIINYHLVQTYLPAVLLMLITWLCFLLPPEMVEARIGISMTTLLTLTAMFAAVREQAPDVSYTMAIDIWMVFCIFLVFLALVLFTVIYWMRRKLEVFQERNKEKKQNVNGEAGQPGQTNEDDDKEESFVRIVGHARRYAFWLFAVIFFVFLITYSSWLFTCSEYFDWDPVPKWNAEDDPENTTNRLFVTKKIEFAKDEKYRIPAADFLWDDVVETVIEPRLSDID